MTNARYDRIAHATLADGGELVRYERAGKWYVEYPGTATKRRQVTLNQAVELALDDGAWVRLKVAGGLAFEAAYRRALAAKSPFASVHLEEDADAATTEQAFASARADTLAGHPTVVFWSSPVIRRRARVFAPDGSHGDVVTPRDELTAPRIISGARRLLTLRKPAELAAVVAFVRANRLLSAPSDVEMLTFIETSATTGQSCDHDRRCCPDHNTHSRPHVGCILR